MGLGHADLNNTRNPSREFAGDSMQMALGECDRPSRTGARVHAVLDIHAKILFAFVFFRGHKLDAHFLGAARNRFANWKLRDSGSSMYPSFSKMGASCTDSLRKASTLRRKSTSFVARAFSTTNFMAWAPATTKSSAAGQRASRSSRK